MCGIVGWILCADRASDESTLLRLSNQLSHRGPDASGTWIGKTADERFQIGFGHRRLSIIDIAGGIQPMLSADGSVVVTFNGEIYNYVELRDELSSLGHKFQTLSDTEVLIQAYRQWGEAALPRFRGMFAFALFDSDQQRVVFARDPFGKKPLFLVEQGENLIFASEIPVLLSAPGVPRNIDWNGFADLLVDRYVPGPATLFRSIKKLPPGSVGIWESGRLAVTRYFSPPIASIRPDVKSLAHAVELFNSTFDDAVRLRMRSDAPFGAYLSGGIDSSAVVAAMTRHSREPIRTFSVGFAEAEYSELAYARTVSELYNTDHHELEVTAQAYFTSWPEALLRRGAPVSEPSEIPILLLSRLAQESVKMVLTGEGSDEVFAGYPKHIAEGWATQYQTIIPSTVHDRFIRPAINALPYRARRIKILARALGERDFRSRMRSWFGGLSPEERSKIISSAPNDQAIDQYPFSLVQSSALRRTLFFDQTSWLPDNLLEGCDRMMMAASIEGRMPFLDVELARVAARFPDEYLTGHRRGKAVLREALSKILPTKILTRKKVGFRVPIEKWFRGPYSDLLQDLLTSSQSEVRRVCGASIIDACVDEHVKGRQNHERALWLLSNLELFIRTFKPDMGS